MRARLLAVIACAALAGGCRGRRDMCTEVAHDYARLDPAWIDRCVRGDWTRHKAECMARTGDGLESMFCVD